MTRETLAARLTDEVFRRAVEADKAARSEYHAGKNGAAYDQDELAHVEAVALEAQRQVILAALEAGEPTPPSEDSDERPFFTNIRDTIAALNDGYRLPPEQSYVLIEDASSPRPRPEETPDRWKSLWMDLKRHTRLASQYTDPGLVDAARMAKAFLNIIERFEAIACDYKQVDDPPTPKRAWSGCYERATARTARVRRLRPTGDRGRDGFSQRTRSNVHARGPPAHRRTKVRLRETPCQ